MFTGKNTLPTKKLSAVRRAKAAMTAPIVHCPPTELSIAYTHAFENTVNGANSIWLHRSRQCQPANARGLAQYRLRLESATALGPQPNVKPANQAGFAL